MEGKKKEVKSVSYYKLFSFADNYDYFLMTAGSLGAVVHGSSMPLFFLLFGQIINGFGKNQNDPHQMVHLVSQVSII